MNSLLGTESPPTAADRLAALYQAHALGLVKLAVLMVGDQPTAEDVVHDAFLGLHRRWSYLTDTDKALAYLRASVLNGCRMAHRKRVRHDRAAPAIADLTEIDSAEATALLAEEHREVLAALRRVPARQREAVVLRYYLDMSEDQAAQAMRVSKGTVKSATSRGLAALARRSAAGGKPADHITLRTYSLATGRALRTWTTPAPKDIVVVVPNAGNLAALSWTDGRTLAFRYPLYTWPDYVRLLDTASKGSDFVTASKPVLAVPGNQHGCGSLLTATDGRTVVCGTVGNATGGCVKEEPEFDLWSAAAGKLTRVLYRYTGTCRDAAANVLWAGPHGTMIGAIEAYTYTGKVAHITTTAGLISQGRFTRLHISVPAYASPGDIAFWRALRRGP